MIWVSKVTQFFQRRIIKLNSRNIQEDVGLAKVGWHASHKIKKMIVAAAHWFFEEEDCHMHTFKLAIYIGP